MASSIADRRDQLKGRNAHNPAVGDTLSWSEGRAFGGTLRAPALSCSPSADGLSKGCLIARAQQALGRPAQNDRVRDPADQGTLGSLKSSLHPGSLGRSASRMRRRSPAMIQMTAQTDNTGLDCDRRRAAVFLIQLLWEADRELWPAGVASLESRARTACRARSRLVAS